ncbi:follistatin-related protein 5-like [Dendronephthya gigantea]|uniref:follistatin-related protein 5-like n=1 Tax=Dendronephthya gigantea TaxID=151771 RepID=UPI00106B60CC|nr:follistatin-related protein 5-like [Dendronephthya gigantea]
MTLRVLLLILVIFGCLLGHSASAEFETGYFYVLGSDGIYVIDPVEKSVVTKITDTTAPGLCIDTRSSARQTCEFTQACVVNDTLFVGDKVADAVHVIDVRTRRKIQTLSDAYPTALHFLPWRKEVWVNSYHYGYTFDVIETEDLTRTRVGQTSPQPVMIRGRMLLADKDMLEGKTAFVTAYGYPGVIHELNLETKNYTASHNLIKYGCSRTDGIAYSSYNKHLYVQCHQNSATETNFTLELGPVNNITIANAKKWNFPGIPFVSPNGRFVVFIHNDKLYKLPEPVHRINILAPNGTGFQASHYPELIFRDPVSSPVFYPKGNTSDSYYVFFTIGNKIAIVDLDLAKNGNIADVKYIEDVASSQSPLFLVDKWIVSPGAREKTVVIINAETQKIYAKISGVNRGHFVVWVPGPTSSRTSGIGYPSYLIFLIVLYVFM